MFYAPVRVDALLLILSQDYKKRISAQAGEGGVVQQSHMQK